MLLTNKQLNKDIKELERIFNNNNKKMCGIIKPTQVSKLIKIYNINCENSIQLINSSRIMN